MNPTVTGLGTYLPQERVTNQSFERRIETTDEWIVSRTGIHERRFAAPEELTSDLAVRAVQDLQTRCGHEIGDVDFVIVATSSHDQVIPSTASQVQYKLGIPHAGAVDLSGACAGFTYALIMAQGLISGGSHRKILVIGAEAMSRVMDFTDRTTCILFGDGAGAVLVEPGAESSRRYYSVSGTEGSRGNELYLSPSNERVNGNTILADGCLHQNGPFVFKWVVKNIPRYVDDLLGRNELSVDAIDWFIPHSANMRIIEAICEEASIPVDKTLASVQYCGNTSTASIPLAWEMGLRAGRISRGDRLLLMGFGGGLTYAGTILEQAF